MAKRLFFILLAVLVTCLKSSHALSAEESGYRANVSIVGPISTSLFDYHEMNHIVCLGFIHCGSKNLSGVAVTFGFNTMYGDMIGIDASYLGSFVQGNARGLQFSVFGHITMGSLHGLQIGAINTTFGSELNGGQMGFLNYSGGTTKGLQLGLAQISFGSLHGFQFGLLNGTFGPKLNGSQIGFVNYSQGEAAGFQGGVLNYNHGSFTGLQISPLNIIADAQAGEEEPDSGQKPIGVQFGFINVSNQERVIPIGLLNFARGGRLHIGIERGVYNLNRVTYKMGSRYFYSVLIAELSQVNTQRRSIFRPNDKSSSGFGFGLSIPVLAPFAVNAEFIEYAPTNYGRDEATLIRIFGEAAYTRYFAFTLGLEHSRFHHAYYSRELASSPTAYALTLGMSFNLLGWW